MKTVPVYLTSLKKNNFFQDITFKKNEVTIKLFTLDAANVYKTEEGIERYDKIQVVSLKITCLESTSGITGVILGRAQ